MRTDPKGFVYGDRAPRVSRVNVAIRAPELAALERSKNRSLRALAARVRDAIAEQDRFWEVRAERDRRLAQAAREHQAKIDADPKLKAEQLERRKMLGRMLGYDGE